MDDAPFDAGFYNDLDATLDALWARLARGAADRRSPMHTVQLATVGLDGGPRLRTVVLRGVDRGARALRAHTDRRSTKAAEIAADPRGELLAYDPRAKIQIRARGPMTLHLADAAADAAWAASKPGARVCYRAAHGPGAPLPAPQAADPTDAARNPADPEAGRAHFAALTLAPIRLEWLYLAARGHRRAVFDWNGGAWRGGWLAP